MQSDDEARSVVTCVYCNEPVSAADRIRYRGFIAHAECARVNREKQIAAFDRRPFIIGALGSVVGMIVVIPLVTLAYSTEPMLMLFFLDYSIDYVLPGQTYIAIGVCLSLVALGLGGLHKNYGSPVGIIAAVLTIVAATAFVTTGSIALTYGPVPGYIDPESGFYIYGLMPGFAYSRLAALYMTAVASILTAIAITLAEGSVGSERVHKGFAVVLMLIGVIVFAFHISIIFLFLVLTILFLRARLPKEWYEIPQPD